MWCVWLVLLTILCQLDYMRSFPCELTGKNENTFYWEQSADSSKLIPFYTTVNESKCQLESYRKNALLEKNKYVVLTIGDSLDGIACESFGNTNPYTTPVLHNADKSARLFNCTYPHDRNMQVYLLDLRGGVTSLWEGKVFTRDLDFFRAFEIAQIHNIKFTHITFASILWDTQNAYAGFCTESKDDLSLRGNVDSVHCLCDPDKRAGNCTLSLFQNFQMLAVPWCNMTYRAAWQESYANHVQLLQDIFPGAMLYLRTQPPSGNIAHGNHYCQSFKNEWIRRQVASQRWQRVGVLDYDSVFESVQHFAAKDRVHFRGCGDEWNDYMLNTVIASEPLAEAG